MMPVIVKEVGAFTREVGVADVVLQSLGLTGLILIGSLLLGLLLGALFIWFKIRVPDNPLNGQAERISCLHLDSIGR
jgi:hypothetical protein